MSTKKKNVEVIKKHDNTIEVAIRENLAKTKIARIFLAIVLVGFVAVPVVGLIYAIINMLNNL